MHGIAWDCRESGFGKGDAAGKGEGLCLPRAESLLCPLKDVQISFFGDSGMYQWNGKVFTQVVSSPKTQLTTDYTHFTSRHVFGEVNFGFSLTDLVPRGGAKVLQDLVDERSLLLGIGAEYDQIVGEKEMG